MKRRILSFLILTVLAVFALASCDLGITKKEYQPTADSYFSFNYNEETDTFTIAAKSGVNLPNKVYLPITHGGKPITAIAYEGFIGNEQIERVTIPSGYEIIGASAFKDCKNLKSVTVYGDLVEIGAMAFSECKELRSVSFPESLKKIGAYAFHNSAIYAARLKAVEIIGDYAFYGCEYLKTVVIPKTTTEIGEHAFGGCGIVNFDVASDNPKYSEKDVENWK